ncbi:hypothetical protein COCNU_07G010450 [Cocos nucifera]|uniref:Uncharacterized protein n=1 Tax=Cocos nucifera TaxID=13894 RepID=A0A8K0N524_COCNU|nr:hypothetical protein COCNU_07G010450 [Cocos nucifera]
MKAKWLFSLSVANSSIVIVEKKITMIVFPC